jgi:hypothetical protein
MSKRTLIITGTTDFGRSPDSTDNTMEEVFDLTLPSKKKYAQKHGYDFLAMRSFGIDKQNRYKPSDIGFLRALRTFEMLESYDCVMWIDADSLVTNTCYKIEDFLIPDNHVFYASYDWTGKFTLSGGNFIIQNTDKTIEFLNYYYKISKHFEEEQTTLNYIAFKNPELNYIKILEHKFLGSVPSIDQYTTNVWGRRPDPPYPWNRESFLVHVTGIGNKERIEILKKHYNLFL